MLQMAKEITINKTEMLKRKVMNQLKRKSWKLVEKISI